MYENCEGKAQRQACPKHRTVYIMLKDQNRHPNLRYRIRAIHVKGFTIDLDKETREDAYTTYKNLLSDEDMVEVLLYEMNNQTYTRIKVE